MANDKQHPIQKHKDSLGLNQRVMVFICTVLGNPYTFYLFCIMAASSLPGVLSEHNYPVFVAWLTQTFIQLVALAALQCGANIAGDLLEQHINSQYEINLESLTLLRHIGRKMEVYRD